MFQTLIEELKECRLEPKQALVTEYEKKLKHLKASF